jgi:predicted acyl esterase
MRTHVAGLTAVMPIIGWSDLYQALAPNNVTKLSYTLGLFVSGFDPFTDNYAGVMFDWFSDLLDGKPEKVRTGDARENIDWRSVIFDPGELTVPTYIVQGWRDYLFPPEQALALVQNTNSIPFLKLYIGGLGHPPATTAIDGAEGLYLRDQAMRWFDFWLKGIDTSITNEPPITVAPEDTDDWSANVLIQSTAFPLPGTVTNAWFINVDALSPVAPTVGKVKKLLPSSYKPGVLFPLLDALHFGDDVDLVNAIFAVNAIINDGATDILSAKIFTKDDNEAKKVNFFSDPLPGNLTAIGSPVVRLYVSAKKRNAYYYVQVEERLASGNTKLVTRGAFKDPSLTPRTSHRIEFSPFAIHHTFTAGSQIKLRIASRDYPFFLPNLGQPTVKIYRDAGHPSSLLMPVVP